MRFVGCGMLAYVPGRIVACLTQLWWAGPLAGLLLAGVLYWAIGRWRPVHEGAVEW
jgi:cytosine/uracil/thiamine/allantoin permease